MNFLKCIIGFEIATHTQICLNIGFSQSLLKNQLFIEIFNQTPTQHLSLRPQKLANKNTKQKMFFSAIKPSQITTSFSYVRIHVQARFSSLFKIHFPKCTWCEIIWCVNDLHFSKNNAKKMHCLLFFN